MPDTCGYCTKPGEVRIQNVWVCIDHVDDGFEAAFAPIKHALHHLPEGERVEQTSDSDRRHDRVDLPRRAEEGNS